VAANIEGCQLSFMISVSDTATKRQKTLKNVDQLVKD